MSQRASWPSGPPGKRLYAIGDVHGRLDLLHMLLADITAHDRTRSPAETIIVLLGDVIDRGPSSREVVDFLLRPPTLPGRLLCLMGNHEELLLQGLSGEPDRLITWLASGGRACARSYGVDVGRLVGADAAVIEAEIARFIPQTHLALLRALPNSARFGDYLLVHAGVRPGVKFEEQRPHDLRWIRKEFLASRARHDYMVVHGHSVSADIQECPNRIGIDTGAWRTGVLTTVWIEGPERGFLQARGDKAASGEAA